MAGFAGPAPPLSSVCDVAPHALQGPEFMTRKLLIVAHKPSPNTATLFEAALRGARVGGESDLDVRALVPFDAGPEDVRSSNGILLGTTENLGYMSGALKDFFDRIYYPCLEHTQGLPYALYIRAGHDGTGTRRAVESITTGLRWRAIQEPLLMRGAWDPAFESRCEEFGMLLAAGIAVGVF